MLKQLLYTVCVENVTASQLNTRLILELTCVADGAKFISSLLQAFVLPAARLEAGQALLLTPHADALVAALMQLGALLNELLSVGSVAEL